MPAIALAVLPYPRIDPVLVQLGPFAVRWYGLAYLAGLAAALLLLRSDARLRGIELSADESLEAVLWPAVGLFIGARLGYALFYDPRFFLSHPADILAVWRGGMSFHGGLLGAIAGGWLWTRRRKRPFFPLADIAVAAAPIGLGLGRLANFVNGELWGRPSVLPWAMVFPGAGPAPRHPSQLYEALLEGLLLLVVLRLLLARRLPGGSVFWAFVALYGLVRFLVEFTREPDPQIGLIGGIVSMGQVLSAPMFLLGSWMFFRRLSSGRSHSSAAPDVS